MNEPIAPLTPDERESLSAELALGVLSGAEKAQAMRIQLSDLAFAADVARWEIRLGPLHLAYPAQEAPSSIWRGISARLEGPIVDISLERRLQVWRTSALVSGALAASLAAVLLFRAPITPTVPVRQTVQQLAVAQMVSPGDNMMVAARYDPATAELKLRADNMPQGQLSPELWIIPGDGKPRSLGLIAATGTTRMQVSPGLRVMLEDGVTLAITMEPAQSAPHGAPSSAPVAAGKITVI